ncbi:MAG: ATP-binding protein [Saprospiraceae bacterium]
MIQRSISPAIREVLGKYPVVTLTGPRQSGKTTLLKALFPDWHYFSMETPDLRSQVLQNPRELFARFGHRMVLDEVQKTPDILSYIQTIVDEDPEASFILSGSQNLLMMENISQTLAGRSAIFYLLPFSMQELQSGSLSEKSYEQWIFDGCYPKIYDKHLSPPEFYANYTETYVQRDVRQVKNVGNLNLFTRFLSICAGHIGQTLNYSNLANAAGISLTTVQNWLSILETSFIIYRLNPYFRNFNKRIVKAPKLYFYDTGLACSLLRMSNLQAVTNYFQKGALFENFIINEISKSYFNQGKRPPIYYWRDSKGREIDLLLDLGGQLMPVEIKAGRTFSAGFFKNIEWWNTVADLPVVDNYVVYGGEKDWETEHGKLLSWRNTGTLPI